MNPNEAIEVLRLEYERLTKYREGLLTGLRHSMYGEDVLYLREELAKTQLRIDQLRLATETLEAEVNGEGSIRQDNDRAIYEGLGVVLEVPMPSAFEAPDEERDVQGEGSEVVQFPTGEEP